MGYITTAILLICLTGHLLEANDGQKKSKMSGPVSARMFKAVEDNIQKLLNSEYVQTVLVKGDYRDKKAVFKRHQWVSMVHDSLIKRVLPSIINQLDLTYLEGLFYKDFLNKLPSIWESRSKAFEASIGQHNHSMANETWPPYVAHFDEIAKDKPAVALMKLLARKYAQKRLAEHLVDVQYKPNPLADNLIARSVEIKNVFEALKALLDTRAQTMTKAQAKELIQEFKTYMNWVVEYMSCPKLLNMSGHWHHHHHHGKPGHHSHGHHWDGMAGNHSHHWDGMAGNHSHHWDGMAGNHSHHWDGMAGNHSGWAGNHSGWAGNHSHHWDGMAGNHSHGWTGNHSMVWPSNHSMGWPSNHSMGWPSNHSMGWPSNGMGGNNWMAMANNQSDGWASNQSAWMSNSGDTTSRMEKAVESQIQELLRSDVNTILITGADNEKNRRFAHRMHNWDNIVYNTFKSKSLPAILANSGLNQTERQLINEFDKYVTEFWNKNMADFTAAFGKLNQSMTDEPLPESIVKYINYLEKIASDEPINLLTKLYGMTYITARQIEYVKRHPDYRPNPYAEIIGWVSVDFTNYIKGFKWAVENRAQGWPNDKQQALIDMFKMNMAVEIGYLTTT